MVFSTLVIVLLLAVEADAQTCLTPSAPGNGSVSYTTLTIDSVADYTCDLGYKLVGAPSATCLCQNECSWSDAPPACNIVDCGFPVATSNSAITCTRSTYLGTCTASCDTGYVISGSTSLMCLATGAWDYATPVCNIIDCMVLTPNVNSVVVYYPDTKYQGVAVFSCDAGYSLLPGTGNRTCPANGMWSDTTPYCYPDVTNGSNILVSLPCSVQWASPVIGDWQIVQNPLASFSPIDIAISARSYLHCIIACNAHARVNCGGGNECSLAMYDEAAELCYTFYEDVVNGTSVGCSAGSRCFRR